MSNNYDEDAILGAKIERLVVSILQKHVDGGLVSAAAMNDLKARLSALEEASSNENIGERTADAFDSQSLKVGGVDVTDATDHTVTFSQASSKSDITSGSTLSNLFGKIKKWYNSFGSLAWKSSVSDADISGTISDSHIASASAWNVKAEQVNVTNYTSFSDIGAVVSAGNIPYYYHAVGSGAAKLYYQGTNVSGGIPPTVSQVFAGVFNGVLYETRFVNGASAFSAVVETPIFSAERVASSGESSSWSSDDTNVPTRAAVESKISSAMSGNIGGFLGSWTPIGVQYYQTANDFKKGDWVSITEAGSVAYYKNNDRSQSYTTFAVNAGDDIYWTTSGEFQKKASTSLQIYPISNLEDWNSLTNTGLYQIASQAGNVQNSPSTGNCVCYVCEVNGAVVQFVISPNHIYKRYRGGSGSGQWGSWTAVDNIEIIVGSTSFNDLKALYGMTKNLVAVGSETVSSNNYTTLFTLVSVKLSGSTPTEFIFERSCPHSAGQVGQVEQKICASSGWSSSTLDVQHAKVADDYSLTGNIATALSQKLGANSVSWLLAVDLTYTKYSCFGGLFDSGSIGSVFWLSEIIYKAGYTARIDIRGNFGAITSSERFSIFPPYGYCGSAEGGGEIRRKLKQYVRYIVTITNTGSSDGTIYACCGGRATTTTAGYWRKGVIWLDGDKSATPASGSTTEWDVGYLNKVALGSVPANGSKTWEFWWYEVADIEGSLFSGCDYMFVTTIK